MLEPDKPKVRRRTVAVWAAGLSALLTTIAEALTIGAPFIDALLDALK